MQIMDLNPRGTKLETGIGTQHSVFTSLPGDSDVQ